MVASCRPEMAAMGHPTLAYACLILFLLAAMPSVEADLFGKGKGFVITIDKPTVPPKPDCSTLVTSKMDIVASAVNKLSFGKFGKGLPIYEACSPPPPAQPPVPSPSVPVCGETPIGKKAQLFGLVNRLTFGKFGKGFPVGVSCPVPPAPSRKLSVVALPLGMCSNSIHAQETYKLCNLDSACCCAAGAAVLLLISSSCPAGLEMQLVSLSRTTPALTQCNSKPVCPRLHQGVILCQQ